MTTDTELADALGTGELYDDRVRPLLLAQAAKRDAAEWNDRDAEQVIAALLAKLDANRLRSRDGAVGDRDALIKILRNHIKVDATGLAPSVVSAFLFGFEDAADAILASLASRPSAAGEVPREPTEAMLDAAWRQAGESKEMRPRTHAHYRRYWQAMYDAALSTPQQQERGE